MPCTFTLVSAADNAFAPAAAVALLSAATASPSNPNCLFIDCGASPTTIDLLERTFAAHKVSLTIRRADTHALLDLPLSAHFTSAAYARLAAPAMSAEMATRLVYLDADTLTIAPIDEIASVDLQGYAVAAVQDQSIGLISNPGGVTGWRRLGLPPTLAHFNSGVMIIHNESWRARRISESALELLRSHPGEATFADQGAVNAVLAGEWLPLDSRWNIPVRRSMAVRAGHIILSRRQVSSSRDFGILHFVGSVKPWQADYVPSAFRKLYAASFAALAPLFVQPRYQGVCEWLRDRHSGG